MQHFMKSCTAPVRSCIMIAIQFYLACGTNLSINIAQITIYGLQFYTIAYSPSTTTSIAHQKENKRLNEKYTFVTDIMNMAKGQQEQLHFVLNQIVCRT